MSTNRIKGAEANGNGKPQQPRPATWSDLEDVVALADETYTTRADVIDAGKAVADWARKHVADRLKEFEAGVIVRVSKAIEAHIETMMASLEAKYASEVRALQSRVDEARTLEARLGAFVNEYSVRLDELRRELAPQADELLERAKAAFEDRAQAMLAEVAALLQSQPEVVVKGLPTPVVNVSVPRRKLVKSITYGPDGRPETITEVEVDDEEQ